MRFELNILFCLLSVLSIGRISDSSSPSAPSNDHQQTTTDTVDRRLVLVNGLAATKSSDDTAVGRISKVLECLANRLDEAGGKASRLGCQDAFSSVWISARRALFGDDNEIGGIFTTHNSWRVSKRDALMIRLCFIWFLVTLCQKCILYFIGFDSCRVRIKNVLVTDKTLIFQKNLFMCLNIANKNKAFRKRQIILNFNYLIIYYLYFKF